VEGYLKISAPSFPLLFLRNRSKDGKGLNRQKIKRCRNRVPGFVHFFDDDLLWDVMAASAMETQSGTLARKFYNGDSPLGC